MIGQGELQAGLSYLAIGRETTLGTYTTCTAGLDFLSCSLKSTIERTTLEQIERSRTYAKGLSLSKTTEGEVEFYFQPKTDACGYFLQNAFGGTVTSATATGETVGAGASSAITHTFNVGGMDQSYPSLCINLRKGPTTTGKVFQYNGVRVNEINFSAAIDEALKCSVGLVAFDSTLAANDVNSALTVSAYDVLSFVDGRVSVEASLSAATTTSFWHVQSVEFGWGNSIKSGPEARRIGSRTPVILPVGMATFTLKAKIRFDTTTAFDAMINATQLAAQLEFLGPTLTGSAIRQGLKLNYSKIYVLEAGDPEVSGPDETLMSDVEFQVLRDDSSVGGYAVQGYLTNQKANYT